MKVGVSGPIPEEILEAGEPVYLLARSDHGYRVLRMRQSLYDALPWQVRSKLDLRMDELWLPGLRFRHPRREAGDTGALADWEPSGKSLYLIQRNYWSVPTEGFEVWRYFLEGALLWTDETERADLSSLVWSPELQASLDFGDDPPPLLQYAGPSHPFFKIDEDLEGLHPDEVVEVEVRVYRNPTGFVL